MKNLLFTFFASLLLFTTSYAQTTWTVDSLNDAGFGSLRAAADSAVAGDTIRFNPNLIASGSDSIVLTTGEIAFDSVGVVVKGLYTTNDTLFISGGNTSRILSFNGAGRIVLDSLVLVNGNGAGTIFYGYGGAVLRNDCTDTLIINNCVIRKNTAAGGGGIYSYSVFLKSNVKILNSKIVNNQARTFKGGGVFSFSYVNDSSIVQIENSLIYGNSAFYTGGGVFSDGSYSFVEVKNSTISANSANLAGGVYCSSNYTSPNLATVRVINSTISGNSSGTLGGGIYSHSSNKSSVYISNSTISGNSGKEGAGLASLGGSSFVIVNKSTIVGNNASLNGGGIYSTGVNNSKVDIINSTLFNNSAIVDGGGIYSKTIFQNSLSEITILSSVIAENGIGSSGVYNDTIPLIISNGYNIFSDTLTGTIGSDSTNITAIQLNLQALAFNGGSNQTVLPNVGSFAIGNGNPNDSSDAQNISVIGIRDIGAAETCFDNMIDVQYACDSLIWINGVTYYENNDTAIITLVNNHGCDSIITLDLIITTNHVTDSILTCDATSYTWIDSVTYHSNNYLAKDTLVNSWGCDSIITLHLTMGSTNFTTDTITLCDILSYSWINDTTYYSNNYSARDTLNNSDGCDSIVTLSLTLNFTTFFTDTIISCNSYYTWINGVTYLANNNTAMDTLVNAVGCDSIITLNLIINSGFSIDSVATACDVSSYTWIDGVTYYTSTNSHSDTLTNLAGCDSVVYLNLSMNYSTFGTDTVFACDSLTWIDGITYTSNNNVALDTIVNSVGCDSIVTLNLSILNSTTYIDTISTCDSLIWINGITYYSNNNTAVFTLPNSLGCDSVVTLNLTINNNTSVDTVNGCIFYTWIDGNIYLSNNNTATYTLSNVAGCDSVVTLNLTIGNLSIGVDTLIACDSLLWVDGNVYTSSTTTAIHVISGGNIVGCDSIVTLNLTILNSTSFTDVISDCNPITWMDGNTYSADNYTATYTLANPSGCDSIVTLDFTLLQASSSTDVISSCNPITWLDGNTYSANNNTATYTLVNALGCDSIITLDFTLLQASSSTDVITSCNSITWIDGFTYNQTTNSPVFTIPNSQGCDSVVTLNFTLLEADTTVTRNYLTLTAQASNATYQWIDCDNGVITGETNMSFTATANGNYQVEITQNGCVDTSASFAIMNVGVEDVQLIGVRLYPNPTSDVLNIDKGSNVLLKITITNSVGATVYQSTSKNQITTINMAKMATGMYVVTLKNELGMKVEKVVKR